MNCDPLFYGAIAPALLVAGVGFAVFVILYLYLDKAAAFIRSIPGRLFPKRVKRPYALCVMDFDFSTHGRKYYRGNKYPVRYSEERKRYYVYDPSERRVFTATPDGWVWWIFPGLEDYFKLIQD